MKQRREQRAREVGMGHNLCFVLLGGANVEPGRCGETMSGVEHVAHLSVGLVTTEAYHVHTLFSNCHASDRNS